MHVEKLNYYMREALRLAAKAEGQTFPNPLVGAVIVRNNRIIAKGYHKKAGGPHAEIAALNSLDGRAEGAVLFCTFEPCAHYGRTGPCVDEIIRSGIKEVFVGMIDPNPLTKGLGIKKLRKSGVRVHVGFLEKEISCLNKPFIKAMTKGLPLVTVKIAESLDGKTATSRRESKWITSKPSRLYSKRARSSFDAIVVGINTVLEDDPALEPGSKDCNHFLAKIVVDSGLKIPLNARLLKTKQRVIIAAVKKNRSKEKLLHDMGIEVFYVKAKAGRVDLRSLLKKLNALEIRSVLVEGGAQLIGSFIDEKLVDRAFFYLAPKVIGGMKSLSSIGGKGVSRLSLAPRLVNINLKIIDVDVLIEGDLVYH